MYLTDANNLILTPALSLLTQIAGRDMNGPQARVQILTIGLQESRFLHRKQIGGPAHGYFQFELGGGVRGVLSHHASREYAEAVCERFDYPAVASAVYEALPHNDLLAVCFARLLLWTDPRPLPAVGDHVAAWDYYIRNWRPGKPHPETWRPLYQRASESIRMGSV